MAMLNNQMVTEKEREREKKKDNELDAKWYGTW